MKFASDTLAFDINTMLVPFGAKDQGGMSLDLGLEKKLVGGRWIVDKSAIVLFAIRSWLAWTDDEMKGRGNGGPHLMKLALSRTDLLALITLDAARLCKAGQSCSNISLVEDLDISLDLGHNEASEITWTT